MQLIEVLSEKDLSLMKLRTESSSELKTICLHHQSVYLKKYEFLQKACCDPLKKQCEIISSKGYKVKPGQKLCAFCRNKILKVTKIDDSVESNFNAQDEEIDDVE